MNLTVGSASSFFDDLGGSQIDGHLDGCPFRLHVLVAGPRLSPRDSMFEYFLEMGVSHIPNILKHESLDLSRAEADLLFVFPERFMSVHEQHSFMHRLKKHPDANKIRSVDIITQNPLIVGGLGKESVAIFSRPDGDPQNGLLDVEMK